MAFSRIFTANQLEADDEEVAELIDLINELNSNGDLASKLSSQSKICKLLAE